MARHNMVLAYGQVASPPRIELDRRRAMFGLNLIKGDRNNYNTFDDVKYDSPIVISRNSVFIEKIADLNTYDIVEIKGFLNTRDVPKKRSCPYCGIGVQSSGNITYICPAYIGVRKHNIDQAESFAELKDNAEISNFVLFVGQVCIEPQIYHGKKITTAQYTIAVNRKQVDDNGDRSVRTDYIHIKSYGKVALSDEKFLKVGTNVLIEGLLQTRDFKRKEVCTACKKEYYWLESVIEVVPYSVEYLENYNEPESRENLHESGNNSIKDILSDLDSDLLS